MAKQLQKYLRCLKPSGQHKSYRFQELLPDGKWKTLSSPEIDNLNRLYKEGTLAKHDADARVDELLGKFYAERDKGKAISLLLPGNVKIVEKFKADYYTDAKRRRMVKESLVTEWRYLNSALKLLGNVPIDGSTDAIQRVVDTKLEGKPRTHKRRTTSINRVRKYLNLPPIEHLRPEIEEVVYLTKSEIDAMIVKAKEPYATLIGAAFYTGLRLGELFGLDKKDVRGDSIHVKRQLTRGNKAQGIEPEVRLPKNRKTRKALIIPGGEGYVKKWLAIKSRVSRYIKVSNVTQELGGIRFHDLRHSYAVYLISQGATLDWVAQSLGHSRETCERFYAGHVLADDAITLLRALLKKEA